MAERIEFLEPVRVTKLCDKCNEAMVFSGQVLTTYPGQYPHYCSKCGNKQTYFQVYPGIEYRTKGGAV